MVCLDVASGFFLFQFIQNSAQARARDTLAPTKMAHIDGHGRKPSERNARLGGEAAYMKANGVDMLVCVYMKIRVSVCVCVFECICLLIYEYFFDHLCCSQT